MEKEKENPGEFARDFINKYTALHTEEMTISKKKIQLVEEAKKKIWEMRPYYYVKITGIYKRKPCKTPLEFKKVFSSKEKALGVVKSAISQFKLEGPKKIPEVRICKLKDEEIVMNEIAKVDTATVADFYNYFHSIKKKTF